jgi:hypothetical protein
MNRSIELLCTWFSGSDDYTLLDVEMISLAFATAFTISSYSNLR